jgi:hypothetical protein
MQSGVIDGMVGAAVIKQCRGGGLSTQVREIAGVGRHGIALVRCLRE